MTDLFLFAGGGSGGHVFPGIAVAEALLRAHPRARVLFVGSDREVEHRILTEHGYPHIALPIAPLRDLRRRPDRFVWRNWQAMAQAKKIVRDERPRAVIGLGGLASAPTVWAAQRAGVPTVLLEQNAIPGRATCWLAKAARVICIAFPECLDHLPRGVPVLICGNPVRQEIARLSAEPPRTASEQTLLVLGGSQGAEPLNDAMVELVRQRHRALAGWKIVHQTGPRQADTVQAAYAALGQPHVVADFFTDLPARYRGAGLAIARAGATTLSELACSGTPMLLVPYPHAADDHQQANAETLARHGAAAVVLQSASPAVTAERLWTSLEPWLNDDALRQQFGLAARALAHPDAAERIVALLQDAVRSAA